MKSAISLILGLSMLATATGCDDGGGADDEGNGPKAVAGSSSNNSGSGSVLPGGGSGSGSGGTGSATGGSDGGMLPPGVPLTPTDGWVDMGGNTIGIQGAMFAYADPTSGTGMMENFAADKACITGTAAKVDKMSTACSTMMFTPPATDCYGEYWGAAIGLNLNQPIDPVTMEGQDPPLAYDAGAAGVTGFAFEITGDGIPTTLRFKVEDASGEYCTPATKAVKAGANTYLFEDLVKECWEMDAAKNPNASAAKSGLVKIAWQVTTKDTMAIPFDYCVQNVRALQ